MKKPLALLTLMISASSMLFAQSWKTDTTWISGKGAEWDTLISKARGYSVWHSDGRVIIGGYRPSPEYGDYPYLLQFNLADAAPVAQQIPFNGFPERLFRNTTTGIMNYFKEHFFRIPELNRIVWHYDHYVTVTDTNYRYIKSYFEPMDWKNGKDRYYADYTMHVNAHHYIRFLGTKYERKDFIKGKREGIARFGRFEAPGLKSDEFVGIGRLNPQAILDTQKVKIRHQKAEVLKLCDPLHIRWVTARYATYLDANEVLWFSDDFGRNVVRYDLNSGRQQCYSLMNHRPPFLPSPDYDILPKSLPLNDKREYDFNKLNLNDDGAQIVHSGKDSVGVLDHLNLWVDESRDVLFRYYVIRTNDSTFIETLKPYFLPNVAYNPSRRFGYRWLVVCEFRKLSTMEVTRTVIVPDREYYFVKADPDSFTLLKAMGEGEARKFGLVRVY